MEVTRFGKNIVRVVRLERDQAGNWSPVVLHETKTKKRKKSKGPLGVLDRAVRRVASAQAAFANSYLDRHNQSSQKRRDGWFRDMPVNVVRANRKGIKKLRISRLLAI